MDIMDTLRILVVSQKGGVGKSTVSANLAAWYSEFSKKNTVLLDLDPHGSSSSWIKNARDAGVLQEHFVAEKFGERRWLIDSRNKIRKHVGRCETIICDLTWTAAMDAEFMHEFDLVVVPSSVSSIELNATMKFLESIKWVFEARAGIPPTLLICPSRVLDDQLKEDPFSKENFLMPFLLLPPVLDDPEIRKLFKEKFIFDFDRPSAASFLKCAESIKQAGEIHKKINSNVKLKLSDRRILDSNNTKLSRFMSQKSLVSSTQSKANGLKSDLRPITERNKNSRVSSLMKILTSALVQK
jgi:cellulose biosynthesis protein BcsQ